jgi:hypothetical protein
MTPKEKADDLINQMWHEIDKEPASHDAKMCALVAVDGIINSYDALNQFSDSKWSHNGLFLKYWEKVKQEILNRI